MRFGRILLASLTALAAYSYTQADSVPRPITARDTLPGFLQVVAPLLACAVDSTAAAPVVKSTAQALFALEALSATPHCGAVALLSSVTAVDIGARRHQRIFLRC